VKPTLLIDCDGVLSDFITPALAVVASLGDYEVPDTELLKIEHVLPEDVGAEYMRRVTTRGFCSSLLPYPGAQDAVRELRELAEVVIVTASFGQCPTWAWERTTWLADHFGIEPGDVVHAGRKHRVVGDVFVDDHPKHVAAWAQAHPRGTPLLWDRAYNRDSALPRTSSWSTVLTVVRAKARREL
jgi:5'(3')-deoxyribonucleotidase